MALLDSSEARAWDRLLRQHPMARAIVPAWERVWGWRPVRFGAYSSGELVGGVVLGVRRLPHLPIYFGRVSLAMIGPENASDMMQSILDEVHRYAREHNIVEIELRLRIPANDVVDGFEFQAELWDLFQALGYRPTRNLEHTYFVRIDRSDDELLKSFNESTRRHITKSLKAGAQVESESDPRLLSIFADAYAEMVERKNAPEIGDREIDAALREELAAGHLMFLSGKKGGIFSNMLIAQAIGTPVYELGVRNRANVSEQVPPTGHLLQYDAMRRLRNLGKRWYDLGGAEGPEPIRGHPNYGVWRFKHGFRPVFVDFMPVFRRATFKRAAKLLTIAHGLRGDPV